MDVEYDGSSFAGWQVQVDTETVQGELERCLGVFLGHPATVSGAGRTDAGVHARQQVASFTTSESRTPGQVRDGLNSMLPEGIAVREAQVVPETFHPRHSPHVKTYRYRILTRQGRSPLRHQRCWHLGRGLDVERMVEGARYLVGTHDFSSFRASSCSAEVPVRTVQALRVEEVDDEVHIEIEGTGFLQYMVRIIAGSLVEVGLGRKPASWIGAVLDQKDRTLAGRTAPAGGLTLGSIEYRERAEGG